jgi:hypothetical protein
MGELGEQESKLDVQVVVEGGKRKRRKVRNYEAS